MGYDDQLGEWAHTFAAPEARAAAREVVARHFDKEFADTAVWGRDESIDYMLDSIWPQDVYHAVPMRWVDRAGD